MTYYKTTPAELDLQQRVFELWDRALRKDITLREVKCFREIAEVFLTLAQADEVVAKTELIQVRTHSEMTSLKLEQGQELLRLVGGE